MVDQKIYLQAIIEVVTNNENDSLTVADIKRMASLAEKFYRQGFEDAVQK